MTGTNVQLAPVDQIYVDPETQREFSEELEAQENFFASLEDRLALEALLDNPNSGDDIFRPTDYAYIRPALQRAITESRRILDLEDDWDGEGSPAYSKETWRRAIQFLLRNARYYWRHCHKWVEAPKILPGPYGSIDLHWKMPKRELLINIPANPEERGSYYGDDREEGTENAIRGKNLDISANNEWILMWLMK